MLSALLFVITYIRNEMDRCGLHVIPSGINNISGIVAN